MYEIHKIHIDLKNIDNISYSNINNSTRNSAYWCTLNTELLTYFLLSKFSQNKWLLKQHDTIFHLKCRYRLYACICAMWFEVYFIGNFSASSNLLLFPVQIYLHDGEIKFIGAL